MTKPLPYLLLFFLVITNGFSQRKSDLIAQISVLESTIDSLSNDLTVAKRNEAASLTTAESMQKQVRDLKAANKTLLENLNNFAQISKRNTNNATKALENLDKREKQLKNITDIFTKNDSLAVVVVSDAKKVLGDAVKLGVGERSIGLTYAVTDFFDDYQQKRGQ